jgi:putative ABC transport system substrate-binding protein
VGGLTAVSRRALVGGLARAGAAAAGLALVNGCGSLPFVAQPRVAHIAYVWSGSELTAFLFAAVRDGLRDSGWVEGQNLVIEERTYGDQPERILALAAELVASKLEVIVAGSTDVVQALMHATGSIPIVFAGATDPVGSGVIATFARPGGNVTGTSRTGPVSLGPKLLDLLRQFVPGLARVAVLFELRDPASVNDWRAIQAAAQSVGIEAEALAIASADDLEHALEAALGGRPQALIFQVAPGTVVPATNESALTAVPRFAIKHGLPTASRDTTTRPVGGLLFYGPLVAPLYRRAGSHHVDRILRGAKPADLPVEGPTTFDLVINLTTARTLSLTIPPDVAAQVTEWVQ